MCVVEKCHRQMHMFELRAPLGISGHLEYNFKNSIKLYILSLARNAMQKLVVSKDLVSFTQNIYQIMLYGFYPRRIGVKPG